MYEMHEIGARDTFDNNYGSQYSEYTDAIISDSITYPSDGNEPGADLQGDPVDQLITQPERNTPRTEDGPDYHIQRPVQARELGAIATGKSHPPERLPRDDWCIKDMRTHIRSGRLDPELSLPPQLTEEYGAQQAKIAEWVYAWHTGRPVIAEGAVDTFVRAASTFWVKYAVSTGRTELLTDEQRTMRAIKSLANDASSVAKQGIPRAEILAIFNSPDELAAAFHALRDEAQVPDDTIKKSMERNKTDVVGGVSALLNDAERLREWCPDDKILPPDLAVELAVSNTHSLEGRLNQYVSNVAELYEQYADNPHVTLEHIRKIAAQDYNPARIIEERLRIAEDLQAMYAPVPGMEKTKIVEICLSEKDPLPVLHEVAERYKKLVKYVPPEKLESLQSAEGTPEAFFEAAAPSLLRDIRSHRQKHASKYAKKISDATKEKLASYAEIVRHWASDAPEGLDIVPACKAFSRIIDANDLEKEPVLAKKLWDVYWEDVKRLHRAGFRNPGSVAEYNDIDQVFSLFEMNEAPGHIVSLAEQRPADVAGRVADFNTAMLELTEQFNNHPDIKPSTIKHFAIRYTHDSTEALKNHLKRVARLPEVFKGDADFDESVHTYFKNHYYNDPVAEIRKYKARREVLSSFFADDPDFDNSSLRELSLRTREKRPQQLRQLGEQYKARYTSLKERIGTIVVVDAHMYQKLVEADDVWRNKTIVGGDTMEVVIDDDIIKYVAATSSGRVSTEGQFRKALHIQHRRKLALAYLDKPPDLEHIGHGGSKSAHEWSDRSLVAPSAEDVALNDAGVVFSLTEGAELSEHNRTFAELMESLSDAQRQLLLYRIGGKTQEDMDLSDIKKKLGTDNLGSYTAKLMQRLRSEARKKLN